MTKFKPRLVSEETLESEFLAFQNDFASFLKLNLSGAQLATCYLFYFLNLRFPKDWACGKQRSTSKVQSGLDLKSLPFNFRPELEKKLQGLSTIEDILIQFSLKGTPLSVNETLLYWLRGDWDLELVHHIPSPKKLLQKQKEGGRYVTLIKDERMTKYILGERDQLSFLMHDLIHAHRFFSSDENKQGQMDFYHLLDQTFDYFRLDHLDFKNEFEYLIADMNAYPIHLLKCLKSAMIHYFNDDYFKQWAQITKAPKEIYLLNSKEYDPVRMDQVLMVWMKLGRVVLVL